MDRFKFRLWDNDNECYDYIDFCNLSRTNETLTTYEEYFYNGYFEHNQDCIEQCTGLKDKNGNLIYEGDIIKDMFGRKFVIKWSQENVMFDGSIICYDPEYGYRFDLYVGATDDVEIIGNVHEQKDNK